MTTYSDINGTTLLTGSSDPDGDTLSVRRINGNVVTGATATVALTEGTATVNLATGVVTLDDGGDTSGHPADGVTGQANGSFTFTIWDGALESPVRTATVTLNGVALSASGTDYGALTRSGAGGIALPSGATSITNAGGTNLTVSGGFVVPSSNGVTAGTVTFNNADTWDVTTTSNAYSVRSNAEASALMTSPGVATVSGKSILYRPGTYSFDRTIMNRTFSGLTTMGIHGVLGDVTMDVASNTGLTGTDVQFKDIDFFFDPPASQDGENEKGFLFQGGSDNYRFTDCEIRSNYKALLQASGTPYKLTAWTYRGLIAGASGCSIGANGLHITGCKIHGAWRLLNLLIENGPIITDRNEFYDFGVDGCVWSGGRTDGHALRSSFSWNQIHSPLNCITAEVQVTSVDLANNRLNIALADQDKFGPDGTGMTLNFTDSGGTHANPNGYSDFQDLGGASIVYNGSAPYVQMSQDLTTAGSGTLFIKREQDHGDMWQIVARANSGSPTVNRDQFNIDAVGNRCAAVRFDTFIADNSLTLDTEMQGFFLQDINNVGQDNAALFRDLNVQGNLIYTQDTGWGLGPHNAENSTISYNTVVTPTGFTKLPAVRLESHFSGGGTGNTMAGNIAAATTVIAPNAATLSNNLDVDPTNSSYTDNFVNPGVPSSIADLTTRFTLLSGGPADLATPKQGAVQWCDYVNQVYTTPS